MSGLLKSEVDEVDIDTSVLIEPDRRGSGCLTGLEQLPMAPAGGALLHGDKEEQGEDGRDSEGEDEDGGGCGSFHPYGISEYIVARNGSSPCTNKPSAEVELVSGLRLPACAEHADLLLRQNKGSKMVQA